MRTRRLSHPGLTYNQLLLLVGAVASYWILDSALHVFICQEGSLVEQALFADPRELWSRVLAVCLVALLGIYALVVIGKAKQAVRAAELATTQAARDFMQAIPSGLLVYEYQSPDRLILLDGNPQAERLCGITIRQWRGRELKAIWPQALRAGLSEVVASSTTTAGPLGAGGLLCDCECTDGKFRVRAFRLPQNRVGLLFDRIREEDLTEQQLRGLLKEKETLLEEVRYQRTNDLQVVSNLLDLQYEMARDERARQTLEDFRSRIRAIMLVYQRSSESEGRSRIDFGDYLGRLLARLFQAHDGALGAITPHISVEDASMDLDAAIPCALIVNELVSNSLQHAFPGGINGEILMDVSRPAQGQYRLVVSDNGVGLPDDLDFRHTRTLGLQLMTLLVDQLNGTIELDRTGGTRFSITLLEPSPAHRVQ